MRKGFDGLALMVQETLRRDPHGGHLFVFRGRRGGLIKVLWRYPGAVNRHHGIVEFFAAGCEYQDAARGRRCTDW